MLVSPLNRRDQAKWPRWDLLIDSTLGSPRRSAALSVYDRLTIDRLSLQGPLPSSLRPPLPLRLSPSPRQREKFTRPRGIALSRQHDFSLSANEKPRLLPRSSPHWRSLGTSGLGRFRAQMHSDHTPKALKPLRQAKPRWVPQSAARRRLERLRLFTGTSSASPLTELSDKTREYKILLC